MKTTKVPLAVKREVEAELNKYIAWLRKGLLEWFRELDGCQAVHHGNGANCRFCNAATGVETCACDPPK